MLSEYEQNKEIEMVHREFINLGVRECDSEDEANPNIVPEHHYVLNRAQEITKKAFLQIDHLRRHDPLGNKPMNTLKSLAYIMRD